MKAIICWYQYKLRIHLWWKQSKICAHLGPFSDLFVPTTYAGDPKTLTSEIFFTERKIRLVMKLSVKGGGVPPLSVNFSGPDCLLRGRGGYSPFRYEKIHKKLAQKMVFFGAKNTVYDR